MPYRSDRGKVVNGAWADIAAGTAEGPQWSNFPVPGRDREGPVSAHLDRCLASPRRAPA